MHNPYECNIKVRVTEDGLLEVDGQTPEGCSELERLPVSLIFTAFIATNLAEIAAAANVWFHAVLDKKAQGKSDTIAETAPKILDASGNVVSLDAFRPAKPLQVLPALGLEDQPTPDHPGDGL